MKAVFVVILLFSFFGFASSRPQVQKSHDLKKDILEHPLFSRLIPKIQQSDFSDEFDVQKEDGKSLVPLVIIPSLVGNQLEAKLTNAETIHWYCFNNADWYTIFLDTYQFYPKVVDCFIPNFQLKRTPYGNYTSKRRGVSVRPAAFGDISGVEYLDTSKTAPIWKNITTVLKSAGYKPGVNLRAATFDWRYGPDGLKKWFIDTKNLIEETYAINGNQRVATASLSMGGPYFVIFLQTVSQEWKDKFIHSFTSFSGAFGGSTIAAASLTLDFSTYTSEVSVLQPLIVTFGSVPFLIPTEEIFKDRVLVTVNGTGYSARNFTQLLLDAKLPETAETYRSVKTFHKASLSDPGVRMNCIYGTEVPSPSTFQSANFGSPTNATSYAMGDGTLEDVALSICNTWGDQKHPVTVYQIPGMTHAADIMRPDTMNILFKELGLTVQDKKR